MAELMKSAKRGRQWEHIYSQYLATGSVDSVDWQDVFGGFTAALDAPACDFFSEIAQAFPDCKIVMTHRDPEAWYQSIMNTLVLPHHRNKWHRLASWWIPSLRQQLRVTDKQRLYHLKQYGGFDKTIMDQRAAEVKAKIPPERLLVWRVEEGWKPLCEFLGHEVPDEPFPRMNDGPSLKKIFRLITILGLSAWAIAAALLLVALQQLWLKYPRIADLALQKSLQGRKQQEPVPRESPWLHDAL